MFIAFFNARTSRALSVSTKNTPVLIMDRRPRLAAVQPEWPAHCSSPPLQAAFRLPRMPRDVETVTRPRLPLHHVKWEEASEANAVVEFGIGRLDEVTIKVEAEEGVAAPAAAQEEREVRAQLSALRVTTPAPKAAKRTPGRPKGSKSRPRVEPQYDISAPPEREEARMASARIAALKQ